MPAFTLADLAPGQRGTVTRLLGENTFTQRLMQLGFVEDTQVQLIRRAPTGDPLEVEVMGYALSLRLADAQLIHVSPLA